LYFNRAWLENPAELSTLRRLLTLRILMNNNNPNKAKAELQSAVFLQKIIKQIWSWQIKNESFAYRLKEFQ
jgi:hypothetical protein